MKKIINLLKSFFAFFMKKNTLKNIEKISIKKEIIQLEFDFEYIESDNKQKIKTISIKKVVNKTNFEQLEFNFEYVAEDKKIIVDIELKENKLFKSWKKIKNWKLNFNILIKKCFTKIQTIKKEKTSYST